MAREFNDPVTVKEFKKSVSNYFDVTPLDKWTLAGCCVYAGITTDHFRELENKDEFKPSCAFVRAKIEEHYETGLTAGKSPTNGSIFALKNMYGYTDEKKTTVGADTSLEKMLKDVKVKA